MDNVYPIPEAIQREDFDGAYDITQASIASRSKNFDSTSIKSGKMGVSLDSTCFNCGNDHGRANRILEVGRVAFTPATWRKKLGRKEGSAPATIIAACEDARINTRLVQSGKEPTPMMFCSYKNEHYRMMLNVFFKDNVSPLGFIEAICAIISSYNSDDLPEFKKAQKELTKKLTDIGDDISLIKIDLFNSMINRIVETISKHMDNPNPEFKDTLNLGNELMKISNDIQNSATKSIKQAKKKQEEMRMLMASEARQQAIDNAMAAINSDAEAQTNQTIDEMLETVKLAQRQAKKAEEKADKEGAIDFQAIIDAEKARKEAAKQQEKSEKMLAEREKLKEKIAKKLAKTAAEEAEKKAIEKLATDEAKRQEKINKLNKKEKKDKKRPLTEEEYLRKRRADGTAKITKRDGHGNWGDMNIIELPMTANTVRGIDKKLTMRDEGAIPTRFDRWSIDKRIFPRKIKANGAVVLVDVSGSMNWSDNHLTTVLKLFPAATVAIYSGTYSSGNLVIVAKNGKRAEMVETYRYQLGGNIIDGMALEWLSEQDSEIKIWMSDGGVSGKGQSWLTARAIAELGKFLHRNKIMQVNDASEVIDVLNGKKRFVVSNKVKLPSWYIRYKY